MRTYLLAVALFLCCSCQMQGHKATTESEVVERQSEVEKAYTSLIVSAIKKCYSNARDISIKTDFLSSVSLFWSDPGYVKGPTIPIDRQCLRLHFSTDTFNEDGTIRYTDDYDYYIINDDRIAIRKNRYHGKGYHGGSCVLIKSESDMIRFTDVPSRLVRTDDKLLEMLNITWL